MTEEQAVEMIEQRWLDVWPGLQPTVPHTFEDETFAAVDAWVRVSIRHTVRNQATVGPDGARKFFARGQIFVQLFGSADQGRKPLAQLADSVRKVYESIRISDITTHAGSTRESPTDGRWVMRVVTIPFGYEDTR